MNKIQCATITAVTNNKFKTQNTCILSGNSDITFFMHTYNFCPKWQFAVHFSMSISCDVLGIHKREWPSWLVNHAEIYNHMMDEYEINIQFTNKTMFTEKTCNILIIEITCLYFHNILP